MVVIITNGGLKIKPWIPLVVSLAAFSAIVATAVYLLVPTSAPPSKAPGTKTELQKQPTPGSAKAAQAPTGNDQDFHRENVQVVTEPPVPFPQSKAAKAIKDAFTLLGQGTLKSQYKAPPELWNVVEHNMSTRDLAPGLDSFYTSIMLKGSYQIVGNVIPGPDVTAPKSESGRRVEHKVVYLLLQQGETWWQIKARAEFLTYADGRVLISQLTWAVMEMARIEPGLLPKYKAAHGL